MKLPRVRFTIRGLMIAVVVVAGLFAMPGNWRVLSMALASSCLAPLAAWWIHSRRHRRIAAFCFWAPAIAANASYVALCISPTGWLPIFLFGAWMLLILPTTLAFGVSWASLVSRGAEGKRSPAWFASAAVIVLSFLPSATALTLWPLRLAFPAARPALGRLADQLVAGRPVRFPQRAGPFRIAGARVDFATGDVGLMIDPDPNGPTAFVRGSGTRSGPFGCYRPIRGDVLDIRLGGGWCFHVED
jgi:hypothetical protein